MQASPSSPLHAGEPALVPYLRALRTHKLVVLAVTAATLVAALLWIALRDPQYEASAQVLINPLSQEDDVFLGLQVIRGSDDPTRTVQTAATLLKARAAAAETARELGDGWTTSSVLDAIEIEPQGESNILAVTATAGDAEEAARLANAFATNTLELRVAALQREVQPLLQRLRQRQEVIAPDSDAASVLADRINQLETVVSGSDPSLSLAQRASVPDGPTGASALIVLILALVAGLALGAGAAVLMELLDHRIRDEDEALAIFPLPTLVRVPKLSRQLRRGQERWAWVMPPAVREAFRTLAVQLPRRDNGRGGRVVLLTSASTGDGKTTSAINLALSLATAGERVLLLDLDVRKPDVAPRLHLPEATPLRSLLDPSLSLDELLVEAPQFPSVDFLAPVNDERSDPAFIEALHRRLPAIVDEARQRADTVVIDTAPLGEVSDALRVIGSADELLMVVRPGGTDRVHLRTARDLLERADRVPRGYIVIGGAAAHATSLYGYGGGERELFLSASKAPPSGPSTR